MAKQQSFAAPAAPTDVSGSSERDGNAWRTGLKAAASIFRGAIRGAGLAPVPKSAKAYYVGVPDVHDTVRNSEQSAYLRDVEASLLKALASEYSSDGSARLLVLLEEVRARIRNIRA